MCHPGHPDYKIESEMIKQRVQDLLVMWDFTKMNYFYFRQKYSLNSPCSKLEQDFIKKHKVTKKEIYSKIEDLEKHALYKTLMRTYRLPTRVSY